ncbi:hypothetical protein N7478_000526 [Penicillium angulare]|uniref:uncharacterized protein n=1 Tax=Penicillium angulare TaxID=116970 RepID=UPI0025408F82|nr:uncharacterized protein N7478_000526 [Penicillium angulare]KAJ5291275.1 hypothetical protein N7478_000526 [Penicillium angulare]
MLLTPEVKFPITLQSEQLSKFILAINTQGIIRNDDNSQQTASFCEKRLKGPPNTHHCCQEPHSSDIAQSTENFTSTATILYDYKSDKSDFGYLESKPEIPLAMSFRSIGIWKNTKLLLFIFICVSGTIQLFIWSEELWKWWKNEEGDEV